ncbi:MAG: sugar transporter permease [Bacilli bacterium]|nr:sugar transporter permease [Bacilli bacterium]
MEKKNGWTLILFLGPFLLFFLVFNLTPLVGGAIMSFTEYPLLGDIRFTWFDNYIKAISDPIFLKALKNTLIYVLGIVPLFVISMLTALSIHQVKRGKRLFRTILFMPYIIPMAVHGFIFTSIFQPKTGVFGVIFKMMGWNEWVNVGLLTKMSTAIIAVMFVWVYVYLGYVMSILYTGLQEIPTSYYEAATIDGAGKIRSFFSITLPLLSNVLVYVAVTGIVLSFQIFPLVWTLTGSGMGMGAGGPSYSTISMDLYIYQSAFRDQNLGYASAMGFLMLIVTFIIATLPFKLIKEVRYD